MSAQIAMREIFVPFSEAMVAETGLDMGRLVPFKLEYDRVCVVIGQDGTETEVLCSPDLD